MSDVLDANLEKATATTQYEYDAANRLIAEIDPYGKQTLTEYDGMGRILTITTKAPNTVDILEVAYQYDENGNVIEKTESGAVSTYVYNELNELIEEITPTSLHIFYTYDRNHRLISTAKTSSEVYNAEASDLRVTSQKYDYLGRLVDSMDELGRHQLIRYDAYGNVNASISYDGQFVRNTYSANNQLEISIDARGNKTEYHYNELNQLVSIIDDEGNISRFVYDALGNIIQSENALGEIQSFEVDMYGNITRQVDALGHVITSSYGPQSLLKEQITFDSEQNELLRTIYTYDLLNRLIKEKTIYTNPLTNSQEITVVQNMYDILGDMVKHVDARNYETSYVYNFAHQVMQIDYPNGLKVQNTYDQDTKLLIETKKIDTTLVNSDRINQFEYNAFGEIIQETYANNSFKTNDYGHAGELLSESFSNDDLVSSSDDYIKTYQYDENGRLVGISDNANYNESTDTYASQTLELRTYNSFGDLASVTTQSGLVTEYSYDHFGRKIEERVKDVLVETSVNGSLVSSTQDLTTSYSYDKLSRVTQMVYPNGLTESSVYDASGNILSKSSSDNITTKTESYVYDALNHPIKVIYANLDETNSIYNALGQLVKTITTSGESTIYTYDTNGNLIKKEIFTSNDQLAQKTEYVYDGMNQLTQTKELRVVDSIESYALTTNTYNVFGDLESVQDPKGYLVEYAYDEMGNQIKITYASENEINMTYTASGLLSEKTYSTKNTDPFNLFTSHEVYTYLIDGKLASFSDNPPTSSSESHKSVVYSYENGVLSQVETKLSSMSGTLETITNCDRVSYSYDALGRVTTMSDLNGHTSTHYDAQGNISGVERINETVQLDLNFNEVSRSTTSSSLVQYTYDKWGNQTSIIYPDASSVTKTYDVMNRLTSVSDGVDVTSYVYDNQNQTVTETHLDGSQKVTSYQLGKTISVVSSHYDAFYDTQIVDFSQILTYDTQQNVIHEERLQNGETTIIDNTYNDRGELTQSHQTEGLRETIYSYQSNIFGNKSHLTEYYYDGDLVFSESTSMTYNHLNQLETSITSGVTTNYSYDDYGNLIEENDGTHSITYTYDLNNKLIGVVDGSSSLSFIYDGAGNRLSKVVDSIQVDYVNDITEDNTNVLSYQVDSATTNLVYGNELLSENSVFYLSDAYGNIVQHGSESYAYDPYGSLTQGSIDSINEVGYKGEVHDTSDLQYLRARTYSTKLHQFLSEDTYTGQAGSPLSQNRYLFAMNNPFKYSDPSGHYFVEEDVVLTGTQTAQAIQTSYAKANPTFDYAVTTPVTTTTTTNVVSNTVYNPVNYTSPVITSSGSIYAQSQAGPTYSGYNNYQLLHSYPTNVSNTKSATAQRDKNVVEKLIEFENDANHASIAKGTLNVIAGVVGVGIGIIALAGIAAATLTAAPAIILASAAVGSIAYGTSNTVEGINQIKLGTQGKGSERAFNPLRDTVFKDNEGLYNAIGIVSTLLTSGGLSAISEGGNLASVASSVMMNTTKQVATGSVSIGIGKVAEEVTGSKTIGFATGLITAAIAYPQISKGMDKAVSAISVFKEKVANANIIFESNTTTSIGFDSFNDAKKFLGSPGVGNQWHHIVEQSQIQKSGFATQLIQNTDNLIPVDKATHANISGYYSSKQVFTGGKTVRNWLIGQSYEKQFEFGIQKLIDFGVFK